MKLPRFMRKKDHSAPPVGRKRGMGIGETAIKRSITGDPDNWQRAGRLRYDRSLPGAQQQVMQDRGYLAWRENPFAHQIIETTVHYVMGDGFKLVARDERVQQVLDQFWNQSANRMNERQYDFCRDLALFGEVFPLLIIDTYNGDVMLSVVDPTAVRDIESNPLNAEEMLWVKVKGEAGQDIRLRVVYRDRIGASAMEASPLHEIYGKAHPASVAGNLVGQVMYWYVNRPSGARRGVSDILPVLDQIDALDDLVMVLLDRAKLANYVFMKCTDKDASKADLRRFTTPGDPDFVEPPEPMSILWQNDRVSWDIMQTTIGGADMAEAIRTFMLPIAAGSGLPIFFFGSGEETNRASALEMGSPVHKRMITRQAYLGACFENLGRFVVDTKRIFQPGLFEGVTDFSVTCEFPDIGTRDEASRANVLNSHLNAISAGVLSGAISAEQSVDMAKQAFTWSGFSVPQNAGSLSAMQLLAKSITEKRS